MLVATLTEVPSETISHALDLTGAAGPAHVSSSRLTAAGICSLGQCRGRADGWADCTGRRFRGQRAKVGRKSKSAYFAAHGINFYCWNDRAAPQVTLCEGQISLTNPGFRLGISLACAVPSSSFYRCYSHKMSMTKDCRSFFSCKDI